MYKEDQNSKKTFEKTPEGFLGLPGMAYRVKEVKLSKKDKQLWVVIFEDGQWLRIFDEVAFAAGVKKGASLTVEAVEDMLTQNDLRMARYSGMNTLLRGAKTTLELKRKLLQKGFRAESVDEAVRHLTTQGFLDDEAYARHYAECRMERESMAKISLGLMKKGLSKEVIREALESTGALDEEVSFESAKAAGVKKLARLTGEEPRKQKEKLMAFLGGRGYSYELVKRVIRDLIE